MQDEDVISKYNIKQASFEGPLELLLSLVEARKLFVNDIALSQVTEEYISYVKNMSSRENSIDQEKRIADISYFVLIAATLILIKSKSLLPNLELTNEETEKIVDLESRLKLYQIIKNASVDIKDHFGAQIIFTPVERIWSEPIFSPDAQITINTMASSIQDVLKQAPKKEAKLPEVEIKKVINIEEVINSLSDRIQTAMNTSFREFSKSFGARDTAEAKVHVIVSFLAMLELVREGVLDVVQNNSFEDIMINKQETL